MTRIEAEKLLNQYVSTEWLKKHSIAAAAVMQGLAERLERDPDEWWITGLIHDLDFDLTQDPAVHGLKSAEILSALNIKKEIIQAVKAHNAEGLGIARKTELDYALSCGESITGLIVAAALVMPDKKLASLKPSSVVKRMKKKDFARKVSRESILLCRQIGLELDEFAGIAVAAMQRVADQLGL
jgi:putative nucleotidyltransferase with HDIG domain